MPGRLLLVAMAASERAAAGQAKTSGEYMRSHPDAREIIIVGAGAAGLAAAWTLASHRRHGDYRVQILEASERIGGRMFCEEVDGFQVYGGASVIHESFATVREVARALDVELHPSPGKKGAQSFADGRFWSLYVGGSLKQKLESLRTMFFSPQNSLRGMWELARLFAKLRKHSDELDFEDHTRIFDLDTGESFAEFARSNNLNRYLKHGGELDINCFTGGSPEQVGAAYGMALLWLWTFNQAERSYLPKQGVATFAKALTDTVADSIRVATPVERILTEAGAARGVVTVSGEEIRADAVICATTSSTAARIIPDPAVREVLERVTYSSCCNVAFGLDVNILPEDCHAALFPRGSQTFLTMVTNLAGLTPEAAPPGKTLVHALVIDEHARELFTCSDDEVLRRVMGEMRRFFQAMPEQPVFGKVYRWPEAICLMPGGMLREMHEMRTRLPDRIGGLFVAGDYTRLPSLNGAMKSGVEAAEDSLAYLENPRLHR